MNDLTTQRLIVCALWTELKHDRWRGPTSTRDLDEHGSKPPYRTVASGRIPNTPKRDSQHRQTDNTTRVLIGTIHPDHRLATTQPQHVILHKTDYATVLATTSQAAREDLALALYYRAGEPYAWHRGGKGEWSFIKRWDAWLTPPVYGILHKLAEHATVLSDSNYEQPDTRVKVSVIASTTVA